MSNYPDNMDWAAHDAAYGAAFEYSDDTLTAAAMVYLAATCGMDWSEAYEWLDECLSEDDPSNGDGNWVSDSRDDLSQMFYNRPNSAAKQIAGYAADYIETRQRMRAKMAVIKFIGEVMT